MSAENKDAPTREIVYEKKGRYTFILPARYDVTSDKQRAMALEELRKTGFVVLRNCATQFQLKAILLAFWAYLLALNPKLTPDKPLNWTNKEWPGFLSVAIFKWYGVGQAAFLWMVRTLAWILRFAIELLGTRRLLVSFDGASVIRGYEHRYDPKESWDHVDQNPMMFPNRNFQYQFAFNAIDAAGVCVCVCVCVCVNICVLDPRKHGGFVFVRDSAATIEARFKAGNTKPFDSLAGANFHYCPMDQKDPMVKADHFVVGACAGDVVIWDSLTNHQNYQPKCTDAKDPSTVKIPEGEIGHQLRRLAIFIAYAPETNKQLIHPNDVKKALKEREEKEKAAKSGKKQRAKKSKVRTYTAEQFIALRKQAVAEGWTGPHWPIYAYPSDNGMVRPRHKDFTPLTTPACCKNRQLSPVEEALVCGTELPASAFDLDEKKASPEPSRKRKAEDSSSGSGSGSGSSPKVGRVDEPADAASAAHPKPKPEAEATLPH